MFTGKVDFISTKNYIRAPFITLSGAIIGAAWK